MTGEEPNSATLANTVAERIRQDILARGLAADQLFMTEAEVAATYGVSRTIAREAVSQLRALGVLKSRQAKGLLVARTDPVALLGRALPFYGRAPQDRARLAHLRYVLEVGAVELSVLHGTDGQVEKLGELAQRFAAVSAAGAGDEQENQIEQEFHSLLLQMSGNPLVAGMHQVIVAYFQPAEPGPEPAQPEAAAWQHLAIAEAVRQRDTEQARALLRQHLQSLL